MSKQDPSIETPSNTTHAPSGEKPGETTPPSSSSGNHRGYCAATLSCPTWRVQRSERNGEKMKR